ncbi:MAG: chloromuconate cycloisomerase [Pirellulales bacterium]|nr:chloromuconate cycloisomerase [Pirellulales bacterium]
MSLVIKHIDCRIVDHAVRQDGAIVSSLGRHSASRYCIVTIESRDGLFGYGEATTAPIWSGESAETATWMIDRFIGPLLTGSTFDHPAEALALVDRQLYGNPFAKAAVDVALWDLWARRQEKAVADLIADRRPVEAIPTRVSIGCYPAEETVRLAQEFWAAGVRTLKFKTGVPGIDDVARLRAVREELGDEPIFTIDANGAYASADEAVRAVEALEPFALSLVEQPTPRDRLNMLAEVRRRTRTPIMADEAVFSPAELNEALELDAFDVLSIYPGKNGGFTHSLSMAAAAQAAGKACAIGSNLETDLGQAPHACLAASLSAFPVETYACDLMGSLFYSESAVTPPIVLDKGRVIPPRGIGFGVVPRV